MRKIYNMIGLASRAGRIVSGLDAVERCVRQGKSALVIISDDLSANSKDRIVSACTVNQVPWVVLGDRYELGASMGKEYRVAVSINDSGFAKAIAKLNAETGKNDGGA